MKAERYQIVPKRKRPPTRDARVGGGAECRSLSLLREDEGRRVLGPGVLDGGHEAQRTES